MDQIDVRNTKSFEYALNFEHRKGEAKYAKFRSKFLGFCMHTFWLKICWGVTIFLF